MTIVIIHYRMGRTDGVSLEIDQWKEVLQKMGHQVWLVGGRESINADIVIAGLEFDQETDLQNDFAKVLAEIAPDRVIVSNLFSLGKNLVATKGLAEELEKRQIKTVGVHHDFYWEEVRYVKAENANVEKLRQKYLPPVGNWIRHAVINSIAQKELWTRKRISAEVLADTLDFDREWPKKEVDWVKKPGEVVVLQATRIVRRKNIEIAMDFVACLSEKLPVVMLLTGFAETDNFDYEKQLVAYGYDLGIRTVNLNGKVKNMADLLGIYHYADVVTYPSYYEGFGNQFLEAVQAKKPVVVWEYPVFKADIKPLGFEVVSLGDEVKFDESSGLAKVPERTMDRAVNEMMEILNNEKKRKMMVEKNFSLGKKYFSHEVLAEKWKKLLE